MVQHAEACGVIQNHMLLIIVENQTTERSAAMQRLRRWTGAREQGRTAWKVPVRSSSADQSGEEHERVLRPIW